MDAKKRKYPRLNLSCDIEFSIGSEENVDTTPDPESTKTKDISIGGMCFITYAELTIGTILDLKLKIKENHQPVYIQGKVVWREMFEIGGQKGWDNGIEFAKMSNTDRDTILEYIKAKI